MIKLILFDLDGVLVDAKEIHYVALNKAITKYSPDHYISRQDHLSKYDGLKTFEKLHKLSIERGLPYELHDNIWKEKQNQTMCEFDKIQSNTYLQQLMGQLKSDGLLVACCSNSIRKTVYVALSKLGLVEYMDLMLSNEDVNMSKPHPELYWKAMSIFGVTPEETLIVEDSPPGLLAASRSGANILRVDGIEDVTLHNIKAKINSVNLFAVPKWQGDKMNILIPMAGAGSRFQAAGYTFPKPLISVNGKPMIQVVIENLNIDANFIYVVQKEHRDKYNLDTLLNLLTPNCKVVEVDGMTEGAACTTLLAKEYINNDQPLLLANSDQFVEWNSNEFMYKMIDQNLDGGIVTFTATHPKWSFAKLDENGFVTQIAEKNPISDVATVGIYYWAKGSNYVKYAEQMISKNIRANNEFYVCPVFNEAIEDGKGIKSFHIERMWGLGTPEDLDYFIKNYKECP